MDGNELKGSLVNLYDGKRVRMNCKSDFSIGRTAIENNNGLYIDDPIISREHACIVNEKNRYYIIDLNSKNGTKINGISLQPYKKYELNAHSLIEFSKIKYRFEYEEEVGKIDLGCGILQMIDINGQKKCCIELPLKIKIIEYQKEMIDSNSYHSLVEMSILSSDKSSRIYYDISNMVSLDTMIQEKNLSKKVLINLLLSIFEVVKQTEKLLLYPECFILHPKAIFYKDNQPRFIYLPVKRKNDFLTQIKNIIIELVSKYLNENEEDFKNQVLTILSSNNVSLDDIRSMLIRSQEINRLDTCNNNEKEETNEIKKDKYFNLKRKIMMNHKLFFLIFQGIILFFLGYLALIEGLKINQWVGICVITLSIDAWISKFIQKLINSRIPISSSEDIIVGES